MLLAAKRAWHLVHRSVIQLANEGGRGSGIGPTATPSQPQIAHVLLWARAGLVALTSSVETARGGLGRSE